MSGCEEKILNIRIGCSDDFFDATRKVDHQKKLYTWSFAGEIKTEREYALNVFSKLAGGKIHETEQGFWDKSRQTTALSTEEYIDLINKSMFVLCPSGWVNIDTIRVYEALDAGSIPVVISDCPFRPMDPYGNPERNYWSYIFSSNVPPPFVIGKDWDDALHQCCEIINSGTILEKTIETRNYWTQLQQYWKTKIHSYITRLSTFA